MKIPMIHCCKWRKLAFKQNRLQVHVINQNCERAVIHCAYEYCNLFNELCSHIVGRVLDEEREVTVANE